MNTKVMAIHLPQFHSIEENDNWWGKGFTEWTNVKKGISLYPGHYQPRIPLNNNYYDLSTLDTLEQQIDLAQESGIYGFAFYHYYFTGKKLLEKPIENYRDKSKKEFPYCLIWANQSWERTWYGKNGNRDMLLEQVYGTKTDWIEHYQYIKTFFFDKRYIKIDGKPVYIIYLPQNISNRHDMFEVWNELALKDGFKGLYIIAMNTGYGYDKSSQYYDSYMNFEPMRIICNNYNITSSGYFVEKDERNIEKIQNKKSIRNFFVMNNSYSYKYLTKKIAKFCDIQSEKKTFYGVFCGWDNTPRKNESGIVVRNSTPKQFERHLDEMLTLSEKKKNEFIFINAWNEWSEGAYIEPDEKYGNKYLKVVKKIVERHGTIVT